MSQNIELSLLTRVVEEQDFHTLEKLQINEGYFLTAEAREVYRFLKETYHDPNTAGRVPTRDFIRYRFPTLQLSSPPEAVSILCNQLRQEKIRIELLQLAQNLQDRASTDLQGSVAALRAKSIELASMQEAGEDLSMAAAHDMLWDQYSTVQNTGGMMGIPYPWPALNEETQGMQPGQFLVMYGRPKSMKSWLAIYMACFAYTYARRRVLFYTREMNPKLVAGRVAACIAGVDYKAFKNGKLHPDLRTRVFQILKELGDDETMAVKGGGEQPYFIITSDRGRSGSGSGGVGWLQAKIRETRPHLVVVDGMYLMKDDRTQQRSTDWKQIAHISQDLKLTCQEFDIPLIGVTQANRGSEKSKGEDLTELAFSDSLGQDADAVFRVSKKERIEENGLKKTILYLTAPGLREGRFDGIVLNGSPATDFSYIRTMIAEDSEQEEYGENSNRRGHGNGNSGPPRRSSFRGGSPVDPQINTSFMGPRTGA